LDDPLSRGDASAEPQQVAAREALNEIQRLPHTVRSWKATYDRHAADVIAFINTHVPDRTPVFEHLAGIEALGGDRFSGRVPPGFQDRGKKGQLIEGFEPEDGQDFRTGNRWGDLIFWKEVLDLAASAKAGSIIILTNDRKNDWHLGGRDTKGIEDDLLALKERWRPVPFAHPMLGLEARVTAGVKEVVLLDSPYVGALLRGLSDEQVAAFVDVAIVPDPPRMPNRTERRNEAIEGELKRRERQEAHQAAVAGVRFLDGRKLSRVPSAFARPLIASRSAAAHGGLVDALLGELRRAIEAGDSIADLMNDVRLQPLDNSELTMLSRELHDRSLARTPGYDEAVTDLVSILDELPEFTAASLYLGLLASMYLERPDNETRLPPSSPVAELLFARQAAQYAAQPIIALSNRFAKLERWPLYMPNPDRPEIKVRIDIVPDTDGEVILNSVRLAGEEVFTPAQGEPSLQLSAMFGGVRELTGAAIVQRGCELFAVPFDQVARTDDFERLFRLERLPTVYADNPGIP
jgi:hypothetical protein